MSTFYRLLFIAILTIAMMLRFYVLNWDQGFHLHPDERQITIVTTRIEFLDNPKFFAYGNFPIYLLKIAGALVGNVNETFTQYTSINLVGRVISVLADLGTGMLLFLLGKKLFNQQVGLLAFFLYAASVLPIQTAHFYAVDTLLTFFIMGTLYRLLLFYEHPTKKNAVLVGFLFGLSLATKTSALVLLISFGVAFLVDFLLIFLRQPHRPHIWFPHLPKFLKRLVVDGAVIMVITVIIFILFEPYALIDFKEFWRQTLEQSKMTHDAFTFPYTLQYVGKIPYVYELKNIFLWGQGPILATLSFSGALYTIYLTTIKQLNNKTIIVLSFFFTYFLVVGNFAIGFMRYMLPLYPLLALFAAVLFVKLLNLTRQLYPIRYTLYACILLALVWPFSFVHIYTQPNTRVLASRWINENVPFEKTLAIEHWDDALPLFGQQNYRTLILHLYDPDTPAKWVVVNQILSQTDYLIIASNRLYVPLQKLTNCEQLPPGRCYPITAQYYRQLFDGTLGFQKVAEFSVYPQLSILNFQLLIDDSSADESFTVYDHPKVMIFKKVVQ